MTKSHSYAPFAKILGGGTPPDRDTLDLILDLMTLGRQLCVVAVGIVDKTAVVGIEGLGLDRASVNFHRIGELLDPLEEYAITHRAMMLDIHDDAGRLVVLGKEDAVDQELEALERLIPATNKALRFVGPDLEDQVSVTKLLLDFSNETEVAEEGVQNFAGCLVHGS